MKSRLLVGYIVAFCLVFGFAGSVWAAAPGTGLMKPNQLPNGATDSPSNNVIHVKFEVTLTGFVTLGAGSDLTISIPGSGVGSDLRFKLGTFFVTDVAGNTITPSVGATSATSFGIDLGATAAAGEKVLAEVDMITPASFTSTGGASLTVTFNNEPAPNTTTITVTLKHNQQLTFITFTSPAGNDDTTSAEGTGFKITFPSALSDLVHDDNTKTATNPNGTNSQQTGQGGNAVDDFDDMIYRLWASTDSTLVRSSQGGTQVSILERQATPSAVTDAGLTAAGLTSFVSDGGTDYTATPAGMFQNPTPVSESLVTELFTARFRDSNLEGLIDTRGLPEGKYFVYISSDKTSDFFLGRSGHLVVKHSPGFLAAAWDKANTAGVSDFATNSIVQTTVDAGSPADAADITLDSGNLFDQDGVQAANEVTPAGTIKNNVNLIYRAVDYDNPTARVWIFISTNSGLDTTKLVTSGSAPNRVITGLTEARLVSRSDTLRVGANRHNLKPEDPISVGSPGDTTTVAAGSYTVYFAATDGKTLTLKKAFNMDSGLTETPRTLAVKHSPSMTPDPLIFDDNGGDDDIDVETGATSATVNKPQRVLRISWEQAGLGGDKDVDDNATIDLFYSDDATFTTASLLLGDVGVGDTHKINKGVTIQENPDGRFENHFDWDLWTYVSAENTVPRSALQYTIYGVITGGTTQRLVRWQTAGGVNKRVQFSHGSYIRPVLPANNISVGPDDPVIFSWEASDVDNAGGAGAGVGLSAPNSATTSPDILIIMSPTDVGATATYSSFSAVAGAYVANSTDGDDGANVIRLHEGVDTSFVFVANRMTNSITASGVPMQGGTTYTPYIMINHDAANIAAAPFMAATNLAYRVPGQITLTGNAPATTPTNARFIFPAQIKTASGELLRIPIVAEDGATTVAQANIFVSVDTTYFDPVDKNPTQTGTQPYTLGSNSGLTGTVIGNTATLSGNKWNLDFTYVQAAGFTLLNGVEVLANLHLKVKEVTQTTTTITLENVAPRQTSLYRTVALGGTRINTDIPAPATVEIVPRGSIPVRVTLQGRSNHTMPSSDVSVFLRKGSLRGSNTSTSPANNTNQAGGFDALDDATFTAANDADATKVGIQKALPSDGTFTLTKVPSGDYTLVVFVDRYLAGQREVSVKPGQAVLEVRPSLDGRGNDHTDLLAGDAAGYDHDGNTATSSRPDNQITVLDTDAISTFFNPSYNTYADVNGDAIVNGVDYNFALVNATTFAPTIATHIVPVTPVFSTKPVAQEEGNAKAAFLLASAPPGVKMGETFDVAVQVKGAVAARAYEFHLSYDPSKVEPQGVVGTGDLLARYGVSVASRDHRPKEDSGDFMVVGGVYGVIPGATGDGGLATVRFRAIRGGSTEISIGDGFLIDSQLKVDKPKMDSRVAVEVAAGPIKLHDASGAEVLGLIVLDGHTKVDFNDFFAFVEAFGSKSGAANFNPLADLNEDGGVDFSDFFILAENFGKEVVDAPAKRSTKPVGANAQGTLSLTALGGTVKPGQTVTLDAVLSGATVRGVGFAVTYDPTRFEFVEAAKAGEQTLFLARPDGEGRIVVARAAEGGLGGSVAQMVFRAKGEFEEPGRFQVADGLILGADGLTAQVAPGIALDLATAPAQFGLLQNFPNPFNPATTIKYNLADEAQVHLRVYNIVGQVVRTLVQERQAAGRYSVRWDGRDDRGLTVSSGLYFYQIVAGKFKDVKKLMLLK